MLRSTGCRRFYKKQMTKTINPHQTDPQNMEFSFEKITERLEDLTKQRSHARIYDQIGEKRVREKMEEAEEAMDSGKIGKGKAASQSVLKKAVYEKIYDDTVLKTTTSDPEYQYPLRARNADLLRRRCFFTKVSGFVACCLVIWYTVHRYRKWRDGHYNTQLQAVTQECIQEGERRLAERDPVEQPVEVLQDKKKVVLNGSSWLTTSPEKKFGSCTLAPRKDADPKKDKELPSSESVPAEVLATVATVTGTAVGHRLDTRSSLHDEGQQALGKEVPSVGRKNHTPPLPPLQLQAVGGTDVVVDQVAEEVKTDETEPLSPSPLAPAADHDHHLPGAGTDGRPCPDEDLGEISRAMEPER